MRKFKSIKNNKYNYIYIWILCVVIIDMILFNIVFKKLNSNTNYISKLKIDELTKYYLNKTIKNHLNIDTNNYISVDFVNNSIVSVSVDNNKSNIFLKNIINELEEVINNIEQGKISTYHNLEFMKGNNGIVMFVPIGIMFDNTLLYNLGPRIPVKINFLENINAYLDVVVENYGINNSLIKLYIIIEIDEVLESPINYKNRKYEYKFLISSKLINGEVPDFLGGTINTNSKIVKK